MSRIRVMQSFGLPRSTTNPYIVMLDQALEGRPGIDHLRFDWRTALFGRYDVIHFHWPEGKLHGSNALKSAGKNLLMAGLVLRLRISRTAVVRTVHNLEVPTDLTAFGRALLRSLDALTAFRILLNTTTPIAEGQACAIILHGHYRDWFAEYPKAAPLAGRIGYFGLIRRYKGVEALLDAYGGIDLEAGLSLRIGGRPSSVELERSVRESVAGLPRAEATLRFLEDSELVELATSSSIIVLPYRFMHNSGGALAALSLDRPVLLPRNEANTALASEVGGDWVTMYDGDLTSGALAAAVARANEPRTGQPDLSRRDWTEAGEQHEAAYRAAIDIVRHHPTPTGAIR
jgi:beta-1,4-mannosyltransferase